MESSVVEPHGKMRGQDVSCVARGEQSPRPAHERGEIREVPTKRGAVMEDDLVTAPADPRFPMANQTRHCYARYIEYHKCVEAKGEGAPECEKFDRYYRSLCPSEWIKRWNKQRALGIFPGPL